MPQELQDRGIVAPNLEWLDATYDGYFVLNTRSLKSWVVSMWNHGVLIHKMYGWPRKNSKEEMAKHIRYRNSYHRKVMEYFEGRDNFCLLDIAAESESSVLRKLGDATGAVIPDLKTRNVWNNAEWYNTEPVEVREALEELKIEPNHYDDIIVESLD